MAAGSTYGKARVEDPRHLLRFLRHEAGMTPAAIAKAEKVSTEVIEDSIRRVEKYRAGASPQQMDFAVRDMIVGIMPRAKETLLGMLHATQLEQIPDSLTGKMKIVRRPDKSTRLESLRIISDMIGKMQPKAPLAEVNVNQSLQVANLASGAETPEERFRRLRRQQQEFNALPPEVAAVPRSIDSGLADDEEGVEEEDEDDEGGEEDEDDKDDRPQS